MRKLWQFCIPLFFVIGCSQPKNHKAQPQQSRRYVNIAISTALRSLDPRVSNEFPPAHVVRMIFEGLMRLGPEGSLVPALAERYEISDDQTTYTFYLRDSQWTNGDPVTAYDFEYAWKKAVTPGQVQGGAFTFYAIRNVSRCLEGTVGVDEVGIRAVDDKTLVVDLEHPAPYFLSLTACPTFAPVNKKVDLKEHRWAHEAEHCVSNGPFVIEEWKKNDSVILRKSERYWDASHVLLAGIKIHIIQDVTTQFYMYEKGELDFVGDPLSPLPVDIISKHDLSDQLTHVECPAVKWLFVNTHSFPFSNKNFRKALGYAINRQELVDHILQGGEQSAMGILSSTLRVQDAPYFHDADLEKARKHFDLAMKELGLTRETLPALKISCHQASAVLRTAQAIQQQWNQVFGIQFSIENVEWPVHFTNLSNGLYQIGEMGWSPWLNDPIYMLGIFRRQGLNMSKWEHPACTEFLSYADRELDRHKRMEFFRQAEALLMEEMPVIPLYFTTLAYLKNSHLEGLYISSLREMDFKWAYFKD